MLLISQPAYFEEVFGFAISKVNTEMLQMFLNFKSLASTEKIFA